MTYKQQIKEYFKQYLKINPKQIKAYLSKNDKIYNFCQRVIRRYKIYEKPSEIIIKIIKNIKVSYCMYCNKPLQFKNRNNKFCSHQCQFKSKLPIIKQQQTNLEKYGVKSTLQLLNNNKTNFKNPEFREYCKNKVKEKYGVNNIFELDEIKEKIKNTNIKKYGVEHPAQLQQIKEKTKQTNLEKYGVLFSSQNEQIKNKNRQTHLKLIEENKINFNDIFKKVQNTNLQRYGFKHVSLFKSYQNILNWNKYIIPMFDKSEYEGYTDKIYTWKCVKCGNEFKQKIYTTNFFKESEFIPRCLKCYPLLSGYSKKEKDVLQYIKTIFNGIILENDRILIKPYELDIVIPEKKIAIEFNGTYWHQEGLTKPIGYHQMKEQLCKNIGFILIQINEQDWDNNVEQCKQLLNNMLK